MKRLAVFILILTSSINNFISGCVYYAHGEDIRFSIFNPHYFKFKNFAPFYYSADIFSPATDEILPGYDKNNIETSQKLNIDLWRKRCKNIPTEQDVFAAVYLMDYPITDTVSNRFIQYLYKHKDIEAINYLNFAKKCAPLNSLMSDPWERNESNILPQRTKLIQDASNKIKIAKDEDLKLRYAFIAIRLAHYNTDHITLYKLYKDNFSNRTEKNIIDYWSLYFFASLETQGALRNYYAAQIFANAPDKRFMIQKLYDKTVSIQATLDLAKNNKEKAAIWLLAGIKNPARAIESIKKLYELDAHAEGLSFLLLREINKLEDWIYTPYYTFFEPSLSESYEEETSYKKILTRIKKDRAYAQELLNFLHSIDADKLEAPLIFKMYKAYLLFMTEDYASSLTELKSLQNKINKNESLKEQIEIIKALCLTARQPHNNAVILDEIKPLLMQEYSSRSYKFIFAIARELEYKGNTTDAAVLLSKLQAGEDHNSHNEGAFYWKTRQPHYTLFHDYYDNYFFYIDAQYTTQQVNELIQNIENNSHQNKFSRWKYSNIKVDISRLYDLLGTKYLRENDLKNALTSLKKVNDTLWVSKKYAYRDFINSNPFYTNFYNEHEVTEADSIKFNKVSIVATLIKYINKAEDISGRDRDYYYYLIANCYLNMSYHGNSWMMKRYWWSNYIMDSNLPDDDDYNNCDYAKQYYLRAKSLSKNKKFSALCLRMAGRCEKYRLLNKLKESDRWNDDENSSKIFNENKYYKQLKIQYPNYYDDLISNCESFKTYFDARK